MIRAKLGDRVIVHFKNSLPEATTMHWHGLRVPNEMDGAPGVTQPADRDRRRVSLRVHAARCRHVLVSPALGFVGAGRPGPLRRVRRRGSRRPAGVRRRFGLAALGHGARRERRARARRQRRQLRRSVRPRGLRAARQRQGAADAESPHRQAAALARHQFDARPLLQPSPAQPPVHAARRRQRPRGALAGRLQPDPDARRARRRRVHAGRPAGHAQRAALGADGTRLRQHVQPRVASRCSRSRPSPTRP